MLSGDLNVTTLKRRLGYLSKQVKGKTNFALTIKLDFIEDFEYMADSVDFLMFCMCVVRRYYTDVGCHNMRAQLSQIYIEISNTFVTESLTKLSLLDLLQNQKNEKMQAGQPFHKFREIMPKFSYENIWYSSESDSNEQILGKFLKLVKSDKIGQQNYKNSETVTPSEYAHLLKEFYMVDLFQEKTLEDRSHSTYAQYQFWLKSIVKLVKEMEEIKGFEVRSD